MKIDIDKMNDSMLVGLSDKRVDSFNSACWDKVLNIVDGHGSVVVSHPAIPLIFEEMYNNSQLKTPNDAKQYWTEKANIIRDRFIKHVKRFKN